MNYSVDWDGPGERDRWTSHYCPKCDIRTKPPVCKVAGCPVDGPTPRPTPEGWQIVPVEPTEEMFRVGETTYLRGDRRVQDDSEIVGEIYRAMLTAAPPTEPCGKPWVVHEDGGEYYISEDEGRGDFRLIARVASAYDANLIASLANARGGWPSEEEIARVIMGTQLVTVHPETAKEIARAVRSLPCGGWDEAIEAAAKVAETCRKAAWGATISRQSVAGAIRALKTSNHSTAPCDCGASNAGRWAGKHSPDCASVGNGELTK